MIRLNSFTWSETEQLYPYEQDKQGRTLYAKEVNMGAGPNNGNKQVPHNVSGLTMDKLFSEYFIVKWPAQTYGLANENPVDIGTAVLETTLYVAGNFNLSPSIVTCRLIYAK